MIQLEIKRLQIVQSSSISVRFEHEYKGTKKRTKYTSEAPIHGYQGDRHCVSLASAKCNGNGMHAMKAALDPSEGVVKTKICSRCISPMRRYIRLWMLRPGLLGSRYLHCGVIE